MTVEQTAPQGLCESPRCPGEMDKSAAGAEQREERLFPALEVHSRALSLRRHLGFGRNQFALPSGVPEVSGRRDVPALGAVAVPAGQLCGTGLPDGGSDGLSVPGFAGTPGYLSPEVLRKDPYGKAVDLWACGKSGRGWDAGSGLGWAG